MGSSNWWTERSSRDANTFKRQMSAVGVPAGVEEVTAIALLQDLLGKQNARGILLDIPTELKEHVSWETDWGGDEHRKQWHEYKMATKISRPDEQLQTLFAGRGNSKRRSKRTQQEQEIQARRTFGVVNHRGRSIRPSRQVENMCLASVGLFYLNFTSVLSTAFRLLNASATPSALDLFALAILIGGVFLPMPLSLFLTRQTTQRAGHKGGIVLFVMCHLLSHLVVMTSQLFGAEHQRMAVLLAARMVQGLGCGILFQSRYVLSSLSTVDQQTDLQAWQFLVGDFGLGLGALLPSLLSLSVGSEELFSGIPEFLPSAFMTCVSTIFLGWILAAFPRHLQVLPERVRCPRFGSSVTQSPILNGKGRQSKSATSNNDYYRRIVWISGTTRTFVQSAVMPIAALAMRDAGCTGNYRQSVVVAALALVPMPFEAVASSVCCYCATRVRARDGKDVGKGISGFLGCVVLLASLAWPLGEADATSLVSIIAQLGALMIALAIAAPINASRLVQLEDAERSTVLLVWLQAYLGRLLGPLLAVALYSLSGYGSVMALLCFATSVVTYTA